MFGYLVLLDPIVHQSYITTGGQIIIALVGAQFVQNWFMARRVKKTQTQTTGGYLSADVSKAITEIKRDIGGIRDEQRTERKERIMLAEAVSKLIEKED